MQLIRNEQVHAVIGRIDLADTLLRAFRSSARGETALQPRQRIVAGGAKLSTMAAVLPEMGVAGAKVYTTVNGRFAFVILLFDVETGTPIACIEADKVTEFRTAAVTECVAAAFGPASPRTMCVFGTGTQARSHIRALVRRFPVTEVRVVSRRDSSDFCAAMAAETGVELFQCPAEQAVDGAQLVVTATRARTPLFDGGLLMRGAFVAAVGSTLPDAREIDGTTIARASMVVVEDLVQSFSEAGGLILAENEGLLDRSKVVSIDAGLAAVQDARPGDEEIVVFESVGIALEDVAVGAAIFEAVEKGV